MFMAVTIKDLKILIYLTTFCELHTTSAINDSVKYERRWMGRDVDR
jgi:hypothetical protein